MFVHSNSRFFRNPHTVPFLVHHSRKPILIKHRQISNKTSVIAKEVLKNLQKELDIRVIGQPHATKAIVDALHLHAAGLGDPRLPITNLLFLGPTGVGKTELAKVLAEIVFGSRDALLQFDMSKYTHAANVSGLVGTTQGFVGYGDGGLLTEPVIQNPDRIILFDELEKAHSSIYKVLLSVMGSGEIADNRGKIALFNRSIIISTSNLCSLKIQELFSINSSPEQVEERLRHSFMEHFSPEFYGRVTPILFKPASGTHLEQVINKMLKEVKKRVEAKTGIHLNIHDSVKQFIGREGFSPELGFRPTARFIENKIVLPIAKLFNEKQAEEGQVLDVKYQDGEIHLSLPMDMQANSSSDTIQMQTIKNLIAKNNLSEAMVLYEKLISQSFAQMPIWPKKFINLSLQLGKECLEENERTKATHRLTQTLHIFIHLVSRGDLEAKAYLGKMYFDGQCVLKNKNAALQLFIEASASDNPLANYYLGKMYLEGSGGLDYNPLLAERYFDKAIAKGSGKIINKIGVIYDSDDSILVKKEKVIYCFKRAAELGEPWGYHNLGRMHIKGEVEGKACFAKAIDCLLTAGKLGVKKSYRELSQIYRWGLGNCPRNQELANRYEALGEYSPAPVELKKTLAVLPQLPDSLKDKQTPETFVSKLEILLWGPKI